MPSARPPSATVIAALHAESLADRRTIVRVYTAPSTARPASRERVRRACAVLGIRPPREARP